MMSYENICKIIADKLDFNLEDTKTVMAIIENKYTEQQMKNNEFYNIADEEIIDYWNSNCFRATDFEEIENYYNEEDTKIKDLYHVIYLLPSGMLAVIW